MIIEIYKPLKAYVEKTEQEVTGFLEFYSVCVNKIDCFIPKFKSLQLDVMPFSGFSNTTVCSVTFNAYCGDGAFIGAEPISEEVLYEFIRNLRLSEE